MTSIEIRCPCCDNRINVQTDSSGNSTAFLFDKTPILQSELAKKYGIELGIVENEVKNE